MQSSLSSIQGVTGGAGAPKLCWSPRRGSHDERWLEQGKCHVCRHGNGNLGSICAGHCPLLHCRTWSTDARPLVAAAVGELSRRQEEHFSAATSARLVRTILAALPGSFSLAISRQFTLSLMESYQEPPVCVTRGGGYIGRGEWDGGPVSLCFWNQEKGVEPSHTTVASAAS